jgi:hypothetical protein
MNFEDKKLGVEALNDLLRCEIGTVEPFALMLAPVYVFMKLNEKLVSVKAPLDFFTPEELKQLSRYETFYIPKSVQEGSGFQTAAKLVRNLIGSHDKNNRLEPAVYEISNEVILALMPLWGKELSVEPFFLAVFADELCGSLRPEKLLEARETAVIRHEAGILLSGLLTFILLHLGYFNLELLGSIRSKAYDAIVDHDETWENPKDEWQIVARDLKKKLQANTRFTADSIMGFEAEEWAQKLLGRIDRIRTSLSIRSYKSTRHSTEQTPAEGSAA